VQWLWQRVESRGQFVIQGRSDRRDGAGESLRALGQLLGGAPPSELAFGWEAMVDLARRQGVSPFLFHVLDPFRQKVSPSAWQALQNDYYAFAARSLLRERQLERVLKALTGAGIPVVLLKGAALARSIYPDPALRLMGDLDLWIPRDRLEGAREALQTLGYTARSKPERPLPIQDAFLGETQMVSHELGMGLLELHWNAFPGEWLRHTARIDEAAIWERRVPIEGTEVSQLAPEDAVLHTCLHFAIGHQLAGLGLRPLLDLELMDRKWAIDWDMVTHRARAWQVTTATWLILDLWASLLGGEDHEGNPSAWLALRPSPLRRWILRQVVSPASLAKGRPLPRGPVRRLFLLLLVDRPVDAVVLVGRAFFPERRWFTLLYGLDDAPPWRIWLQRLWHPFRVLLRGDL
jgi:hypothetical protein